MNGAEFSNKVKNKEIINGTKFAVYDSESRFIGNVGVIDTTVVFIDMGIIPNNLYTDIYRFDNLTKEQSKVSNEELNNE